MKLRSIEEMKICVKSKLEQFQIKQPGSMRLKIYGWGILVAMLLMVGVTFAWYTLREREAETKAANVMKPYYLTLLNPSETDALQLSVGSLLQGKTKQIVFCISSKGDEQVNKDVAAFEYALELIHTDNLPLQYEIYPLEKVDEGEGSTDSNIIVAEDVLTEAGTTTVVTTRWTKVGDSLTGTDVSAKRHAQVGLTDSNTDSGAEADTSTGDSTNTTHRIINKGTYISYENAGAVDNGLKLEPTAGAEYASQYFVLEISWNIDSGFEKYDKETDMIYILAKAVQSAPEESTDAP